MTSEIIQLLKDIRQDLLDDGHFTDERYRSDCPYCQYLKRIEDILAGKR